MKFCNEIEINPSLAKEYHEQVVKIKDWYKKAYEKYSKLLVSEAMRLSSEYDDTLFPDESIFDLDFHFSTKSSYFSISDALVKLILSMYSFGPSEAFLDKYGIKCPEIKKTIQYIQNPSWIKIQLNEVVLSEILARVLRVENAQFSFDLAELLANRTSRNTLTHQAKADFYNSAIRSYNSIRNMLVFIAPEYEDILLSISFSPTLSFDEFMSSPQAVAFSAGTNVYKLLSNVLYSPMAKTLAGYILNPFLYIYIYYYINEDEFTSNGEKNFLYFFINVILAIIISFLGCVYNEFLVLSCFQLNYETYSEISLRAMTESSIYEFNELKSDVESED